MVATSTAKSSLDSLLQLTDPSPLTRRYTSESTLAASFSDHTIKILDPEKLTSTHSWTAHSRQIMELKFSPENHCHLLSASMDGKICLWDLRQPLKTPTKCFEDLTMGKPKPLNSFDINCAARYIAGGTELIQGDAYILFWDIRNSNLLGGYWDSHVDDITQLKFHPSKKDSLISGSMDGLINLFDISQSTEEDALTNTLNTESSIYKLNWIVEDKLLCLTHTHDFKIWNALEPSPSISIMHGEFVHAADVKAPVDYLVDVLKVGPSNLQLMTGSFNGSSCIWEISEEGYNVKTILAKGHTDVVRTCHWNDKMKAVITGGEDGVISIWKEIEETVLLSESKKMETVTTDGEESVVSVQTMEEPLLSSASKDMETTITGGEESVVSVQAMEEPLLSSASKDMETTITGREESVVSVQTTEEPLLSSASKDIETMITGGEESVVSVQMMEEPLLSSVSKEMETVITGGENSIVSIQEEKEEALLSSESEKVETVITDGQDGVVSVKKEVEIDKPLLSSEIEDPLLSSESKKITSTVTARESRKFRPY